MIDKPACTLRFAQTTDHAAKVVVCQGSYVGGGKGSSRAGPAGAVQSWLSTAISSAPTVAASATTTARGVVA